MSLVKMSFIGLSLLIGACSGMRTNIDLGNGRTLKLYDVKKTYALHPNVLTRVSVICDKIGANRLRVPIEECKIDDMGSWAASTTVQQATGASAVPVGATGYVLGQKYRRPDQTHISQTGSDIKQFGSSASATANPTQGVTSRINTHNISTSESLSNSRSSARQSQRAAIGNQVNGPGSNDENILRVGN